MNKVTFWSLSKIIEPCSGPRAYLLSNINQTQAHDVMEL